MGFTCRFAGSLRPERHGSSVLTSNRAARTQRPRPKPGQRRRWRIELTGLRLRYPGDRRRRARTRAEVTSARRSPRSRQKPRGPLDSRPPQPPQAGERKKLEDKEEEPAGSSSPLSEPQLLAVLGLADLEVRAAGPCADCRQATPTRFRYGRRSLCRRCALSRVRVAKGSD
jgi:hypothetical protein